MPIPVFIHTFTRTHIHKYDIISRIGREFVYNILSHLVCPNVSNRKDKATINGGE